MKNEKMFTYAYHSLNNEILFNMVATIRAPCCGGLDHVWRINNFTCDFTCDVVTGSCVINIRLPTRSSVINIFYG